MNQSKTKNREGLVLLRFLYKYRKLLLIALVIAIAVTVIVTLLMEPKYTSTGIIFATPTNSPEKILDNPQFGYEVDADWLMQVLQSDIVKDTLVDVFNLVEYFDLDSSNPGWKDDLNKNYNRMIGFNRTRYMSIEISATTSDPELSANIVNAIIDRIDGIRESIFKENTRRTLLHYEKSFLEKNQLVNSLMDSLHVLRNKNTNSSQDNLYRQIVAKRKEVNGIREELTEMRIKHDFYDLASYQSILSNNLATARSVYANESGQYDILSEKLSANDTAVINTKARLEGADRDIKQIEKQLEALDGVKKRYAEIQGKLGASIDQLNGLQAQYENTTHAFEPYINSILLERLSSDYTHEQILLNELRYKYENALLSYENPIPSVYVIDRAEPSYEKTSPSLLINGAIICISTLVLMISLLLIRDKYLEISPLIHEDRA